MDVQRIQRAIRDIPDFPKPGVVFKDIAPVLADPELFRLTIDVFEERFRDRGVDKVAAIDARGFLFAGALCDRLGIGLVPIRKKGKLPWETYEETYDLEYGTATMAMHRDALQPGDRVLLLDDLLATGGTAAAAVKLIERGGGQVMGIAFLIELAFLKGRGKLMDHDLFVPIVY